MGTYTPLLHPIAHLQAAARQHHEAGDPSVIFLSPTSPRETLKGAKKFFLDSFRIVFERFEGFSSQNDQTPSNWILKHEFRSPSVSSRLRIGTRKLRNLPVFR